MQPKVSVIIPVYNASKFIAPCLKNCLEQSFKQAEFIFVDDKSTDNTVDLIKPYVEKYPEKIILIELLENKRQGNARNIGIEKSNADYIMFLDVDDKYENSCIEKMYNKIIQDNSDMTVCKFKVIDHDTEEFIENHSFTNFADIPQKYYSGFSYKDLPEMMLFNRSNVIWDKIYKKSFLVDNNIKFPIEMFCEDDVFSFKTLFRANKITVLNESLILYRVNRKDSSSNLKDRTTFDCFRMYDLVKQDLFDLSLFYKYQKAFMKYHIYSFLFFYEAAGLKYRKEFFYDMKKELTAYRSFIENKQNKFSDIRTYNMLSFIINSKFHFVFRIKYLIYVKIIEKFQKQEFVEEAKTKNYKVKF